LEHCTKLSWNGEWFGLVGGATSNPVESHPGLGHFDWAIIISPFGVILVLAEPDYTKGGRGVKVKGEMENHVGNCS
jgi:hypothetical protein